MKTGEKAGGGADDVGGVGVTAGRWFLLCLVDQQVCR